MARRTDRFQVGTTNPLWHMYRTVSFFKVMWCFTIVTIGRFAPSLRFKNALYRTCLRMKIGEKTALALMVMPDTMFPERITIGDNTIIGFNTTILCHEYLTTEYRLGDVVIGSNVLIGANVTILPGVTIGDGAVVGAGSVVHRDIAPNERVSSQPLRRHEM
ncbi:MULTISPECIES: DapH/DapD/GlmU-related protein [unclassified Exiguobacterium]|uniref:acyltransferase n=1 Tax=unclassified Exiguobacterium TaxID=2644629 RepID=UPI00044FEC67|nr:MULTISPECIES: acyltransferase [unclassified Exiguobacterium]EZP59486.1 Acetyltransferase [Exiguobacterium sp. RIT341]MDT0173610.1 acyltransferase [Exiguobacterium sp. BRG2]HBF58485.1 acyltransferase [Exiguobacterium sp.]